jgi:phenylacetate-CoA ligase
MKKLLRTIMASISKVNFKKEYKEIKNVNTQRELLEFRKKYLTKLLLHAYRNVPYYHNLLREICVINDEKVDLSKFEQIPILTKEIMRKHNNEIISKDYTSRRWYYNSSGGSTGEPTKFIQDDLYGKWGNAVFYYWHKDILGIDEPNVKKVFLWGSDRDLFQGSLGIKASFNNWLDNTIFLNSFRMTENDMEKYMNIIKFYRPDLIRGYAGSLYELCRYAERKNKVIYTPKAVISAAEILRDDMREKIESIFGTKLYDFYGSRETNNLAGECAEGLMHILAFHNYIEILDNNNLPVKEGEEGRVIVTNLHNYSMPFIRYDIGDMAVLGSEKCKCGNILPTLKRISGRVTDHFILKNGTIVPAEFFIHLIGVVCNNGFIKKFQVIQEDYNIIKILIIPEKDIKDRERTDIEDKIKFAMGQDCKITWEIVDEISKTPQGKYQYTKSLLGEGR